MESFGAIAPFYDALMDGVPYRMWVSYYLLLLAKLEVRPRKLLEVCCGTGTLCELLDSEGFQMTGFDLSEPMIMQAREKAKIMMRDIRYEAQNAIDFDLGDTFEGAFSFFDSLNYIVDPEDLQQALRRVAKHLEPGGSFIFDLNTAYAFRAKLFDQKNLKAKAKVRYDWKSEWDEDSRVVRVHMKFWTDEGEVDETHVQRAHSPEEVFHMLEVAGFERMQVFDSYTLNPPRGKSDRIHFAAVKAK